MNLGATSLTVLALALSSVATAGVYISAGTERSTHSLVQFYIEDSSGRRSGQPPTGPQVAQIPGTAGRYGSDSISNDSTGEPGPQSVEFHTSTFPTGTFKLVLLPAATTGYWLRMSLVNNNGATLHQDFTGFVRAGSPVSFEFEHQPAASSPTAPAKLVSFASLREDVQTALTLRQLGDEIFVSSLLKTLAKAQAFADAKNKAKQSADSLDIFIHRIDSAFKKEPDPDDGDDPQDKKGTPIVNRFATLRARDSLSEDARILIRGLGETPTR